jgi:hypothetical protein
MRTALTAVKTPAQHANEQINQPVLLKGAQSMNTPIVDFVKQYNDSGTIRFHMPGHKGMPYLGCESFDITEVKGADALYEAEVLLPRASVMPLIYSASVTHFIPHKDRHIV